MKETIFETMDFSSVCQKAGPLITRLSLTHPWYGHDQPWLVVRDYSLHKYHEERSPRWRFEAKLGPDYVTDQEHDSAVLVRFELIDVHFTMVRDCLPWISGSFFQGAEDFRVPKNLEEVKAVLAKGQACDIKECRGEDQHLIIDQYVPKPNFELFAKVRCARVEIQSYFEESK